MSSFLDQSLCPEDPWDLPQGRVTCQNPIKTTGNWEKWSSQGKEAEQTDKDITDICYHRDRKEGDLYRAPTVCSL